MNDSQSGHAPSGARAFPFLRRWGVTTLGVLVAAGLVPGITYSSMGMLLVASLLLGVLNAFVRPVMLLLSLPLLIFSLGLFILFINAFLLHLVGLLVRGFEVAGFGSAFVGGLVISLVSMVANRLIGRGTPQVARPSQGPPARDGGARRMDPPGNGPVIDV